MNIIPRSYQVECVDSLYRYFAHHTGNPVCALPTGTGKSVIIAMFLESIFKQYPNQKILVVTHVKELIEQNHKKLKEYWKTAPAGIYSAGLKKRDVSPNIIFAGIASIVKRAKEFGRVDLIIIDEAHLVSPHDETMYQRLIESLKSVNPYVKIIGFTATPWRLGQGRIIDDGIFTDVCFDITRLEAFNRLIDEGYLVKLIPKKTKTVIDTSNLHIRAGEFIQSELEFLVDQNEITEAALCESIEQGQERKHWLIFAISIEHAEHIATALNQLGVNCTVVHSKMPDNQRDKAISDFRSKKVRAIVNVGVLTTGFDFPEIDMIVMLRPTASTVLWVQMLGRGTRPAEEKENCLVLDFAGNTRRLGPVNDPVIPRKKGEKGGEAPVKICDSCGTYNHTKAKFCIACNAEFTFKVKITSQASHADLIRADLPIVEVFKVDTVEYKIHCKADRPPSMKVSYLCGLSTFNEYVCFEHEGFARRKAVNWWKERSIDSLHVPETVESALNHTHMLEVPTHVRVWTNAKYPEIMSFIFEGEVKITA